jgi:hypothetical protein
MLLVELAGADQLDRVGRRRRQRAISPARAAPSRMVRIARIVRILP